MLRNLLDRKRVKGPKCSCGHEYYAVTAKDGTKQPRPLLPLVVLEFTCEKCSSSWKLNDAWISAHEIDHGDQGVVTVEDL